MFILSPLGTANDCGESVRVDEEDELTQEHMLSAWLLELRKKAKLSQVDAAQTIGVSDRDIRRWERGAAPGGTKLLRLLSAYGVRFEQAPPAELPRAVNAELRSLRLAIEASAGGGGAIASTLLDQLRAFAMRLDEVPEELADQVEAALRENAAVALQAADRLRERRSRGGGQ